MLRLAQFLLFVAVFSLFFFPSLLNAQSTNPWSIYNNPLQSNSLDFYLGGVSANPVLRLKSSDNSTQVRKLIDIDDPTNYYLDPNGSSVLANLTLKNGDIDAFLTANGTNPPSSKAEWRIIAANQTSTGYGVGAGGFGIYKNYGANQQYYLMANSGNIYLAGINNWITNYLNQPVRTDSNVTFNQTTTNALYVGGTYMAQENAYYLKQIGTHPNYTGTRYYTSNGTSVGYVYGEYTSGGVAFGLLNSAGGWALRIPAGGTSVQSSSFVDMDQPAYYVDPNNTSNMWNINSNVNNGFQYNASGQVSTSEYFRVNGGGGLYWNSYGTGLESVRAGDGTYYLHSYSDRPFYTQNGIHTGANLLNWYGSNGLSQAQGHYIWPGSYYGMPGFQQSYFIGSDSRYGLFTNTGWYVPGTSYFHYIYDNDDTSYYLDPNGTSHFNQFYTSGPVGINGYGPQGCGGYAMCIIGSTYVTGGYGAPSSDIRLKHDIAPITGALDTILHLNGVTFVYNKDRQAPHTEANDRRFGFVAQQVEPFIPEAIQKGPDGYLGVDYMSLTALLAEGIKTIQNEIIDIKNHLLGIDQRLDQKDAEIKSLQDQVNQLNQTVNDLKKQVQNQAGH